MNSLEADLRSKDVIRYQNFKQFIIEFDGGITDEEVKVLWDAFRNYVYGCFYIHGVRAREFFHPSYTEKKIQDGTTLSLIGESYKKLPRQELRTAFQYVVDHFPEKTTSEDIDFLNELAQKTICFASLGVSPDDSDDVFETEFIDWVIYVDTNFLFSVLDLHYNTENEASKELLKLILLNNDKIKIQFRYLDITLKELQHKKKDFQSLDSALTDSAIRAILKSDDLDEFSKKYYADLLHNRSETIHPSKVIDLAEYTLPNQGIIISRSAVQIKALGEDFLEAKKQEFQEFINKQNEIRVDFAQRNNVKVRPYFKYDTQLEHDVALREFILLMRGSPKKNEVTTLKSIRYFGLTLDELLMKFDADEMQKKGVKSYPIFFRPSFLLNQLIRILPLQTPDYKRAFIKAISARGFNKDPRRSDDILQIVSYLRKQGIDNEDVIFNLISEQLFLDRYREESQRVDFDSKEFFESELNRILQKKEQEIQQSKKQFEELSSDHTDALADKQKFAREKNEKEKEANLLSEAVRQLQKKVKKLEQRPSVTVVTPQMEFDQASHDKKVADLKEQFATEKIRRITAENTIRRPKRDNHIYWKIFWWRARSFVWIILLPVCAFLVYLYLAHSGFFPNTKGQDLNSYITTAPVSGWIVVITILYQAIFISIFTSKFFQTNKSKFVEQLDIPVNLKDVAE